jgi:hypothetical protein
LIEHSQKGTNGKQRTFARTLEVRTDKNLTWFRTLNQTSDSHPKWNEKALIQIEFQFELLTQSQMRQARIPENFGFEPHTHPDLTEVFHF